MKIIGLGWAEQMRDKPRVLFYLALAAAIAGIYVFLPSGGAARGMLLGGLAGIIAHVRSTWISRIVLDKQVSKNAVTGFLENRKFVYSEKHDAWIPGIHRWLRFDAQNICLHASEECVSVTGPAYFLRFIASRIGHQLTRK